MVLRVYKLIVLVALALLLGSYSFKTNAADQSDVIRQLKDQFQVAHHSYEVIVKVIPENVVPSIPVNEVIRQGATNRVIREVTAPSPACYIVRKTAAGSELKKAAHLDLLDESLPFGAIGFRGVVSNVFWNVSRDTSRTNIVNVFLNQFQGEREKSYESNFRADQIARYALTYGLMITPGTVKWITSTDFVAQVPKVPLFGSGSETNQPSFTGHLVMENGSLTGIEGAHGRLNFRVSFASPIGAQLPKSYQFYVIGEGVVRVSEKVEIVRYTPSLPQTHKLVVEKLQSEFPQRISVFESTSPNSFRATSDKGRPVTHSSASSLNRVFVALVVGLLAMIPLAHFGIRLLRSK